MDYLAKAYRVEAMLKAQYLATEAETDLCLWVDMGLVRNALKQAYIDLAKDKYGIINLEEQTWQKIYNGGDAAPREDDGGDPVNLDWEAVCSGI